MNKRAMYFLLPLIAFLFMAVFLYRGLYSDATELESVLIGKPVPQFTLQDIYQQDKQHDAAIFKGQPLLLNVWATWCPTCRAEHTFLNSLAAQGVKIVGLNYKDDRSKAIKWLEQLGNPYQVNLYDGKGLLALDLGVYGAPETYFIDSQGVIRYRHVGDVNARNWQETLGPIFSGLE
ncbi:MULTISPECIES: DsbE family thiol:disulfide interchange protein [unclassified Agarivorans]|uniref:DsbE family thiol:disulfide interchange protein n=1 Tax=unclassified Agarivorans TaxID=2636026 RepID=UPI0010DE2FC4|nr:MULTISPECIES: DsbE family thiol:disulfide interchange protein [unclassified Agarivorans]MDO6686241.1 DsbE family thiol:disulfide interchange protein [Agarivorans sp. 3_MG-2023]MDO6716310.1 DsbE family thiol:disulfide interchange protein [Agarivorans sp. 2_MG-2023]GDY24173.1 thiol:disulfide interchange protein DsbE [Agarivorans sp. Toyoura001]